MSLDTEGTATDVRIPTVSAVSAPIEVPARRAGAPSGTTSTPVRRRQRQRRTRPWWIRLHRWVSLGFGLVLLVEIVSGVILLLGPEVEHWSAPENYRATTSADPLTAVEVLELVRRELPELAANGVGRSHGVWVVEGDREITGSREVAFVDPGTGQINAVAQQSPWFMRAMDNIHECAFSCEAQPLYMAWTDAPVPGTGGEVSWAGFTLGFLGVLLVFLCGSGLVIWWPTLRTLRRSLRIRRGRGAYVRDLDWHTVVGIVATPMLLMWGISGANFEFEWPGRAYYAVLPGSAPAEPEKADPGTGPQIGVTEAAQVALAAYPGANVVDIEENSPAEEDGSYEFGLREATPGAALRPGAGSQDERTVEVEVDSHGGGILAVERDGGGPVAARYWEDWQDELHFGTIAGLPWAPRLLIFGVFGLTPVLLAITGITVWLVKRRSARNRRAAAGPQRQRDRSS